jgi:tryptophan-rich sensory protein
MNLWLAYILSFATTLLAALAGSAASIQAGSFYAGLNKPTWAPPASVFGPVWTVLYLMMAIAGGMALSGNASYRWPALLFVVQLALNALWSWTFFKWESGAGSMATIAVLWIFIVATTATFWRANAISGWLMIPYLGWVSFAAVLNAAVWRLNPDLL